MVHTRDIDFIQTATIVTNPSALKGNWTQILCLSDCTSVSLIDNNLTDSSEAWSDAEFTRTSIIVGKFESVTLTGKVVLYA